MVQLVVPISLSLAPSLRFESSCGTYMPSTVLHALDTGALTHLAMGTSLIDIQSYEFDESMGRKLHGGGSGLSADKPLPSLDVDNGTLDHFAINVAPYDPVVVKQYLTDQGYPPFAEGERFGADGNGYSLYLHDPDGNAVELKGGTPLPPPATIRTTDTEL